MNSFGIKPKKNCSDKLVHNAAQDNAIAAKESIIVQDCFLDLSIKKTTLVVLYYLIMKKFSYLIIILLVSFAGFSQTDTSLNRRLKEYIRLNKELKFVELMEYLHPSLFELAPKEQMIGLFENVYDNADMKITIEKIEVRTISAPFTLKAVQYYKVDYDMAMQMKFKDENKISDSNTVKTMISSFQEVLPGKEVSFNASGKYFVIKGSDVLIAIKDNPETQWLFLGYDGNNEMVKKLFPQELIEHFKLQ